VRDHLRRPVDDRANRALLRARVAQEKKEAVAQQPQAGEEQAQEKFVEEVVVTAQKRTETFRRFRWR